jgi:(E)-4-hydroxy-3-methylbut-2-enyl-diphosphate synthase
VGNIGGDNVPVVVAERLDGSCSVNPDLKPDYIYVGRQGIKQRIEGVQYIVDADLWQGESGTWPAFNHEQMMLIGAFRSEMKFLFMPYMGYTDEARACLKQHPEIVIISQSDHQNRLGEHRALVHQLSNDGLRNPVVFFQHYAESQAEDLQIKAAADMGALIFDGLCDGVFVYNHGPLTHQLTDATMFGILQAGRLRTSKTEYISCPGCGRTLFNLQSTIARIKEATAHLKGLKIGIMGCIVNGPGEMADADYGYVGAGRGKVSLYKRKECIEKNIPEEEAVEKLIELIKANGDYR